MFANNILRVYIFVCSTCPLPFKTAGWQLMPNVCASHGSNGERLKGNTVMLRDASTVAVLKDEAIVGHIPHKISATCSMFLHRGGSILCQVTESKHYSADQLQGGLKSLCILVFIGMLKTVPGSRNSSQALSVQLRVYIFKCSMCPLLFKRAGWQLAENVCTSAWK